MSNVARYRFELGFFKVGAAASNLSVIVWPDNALGYWFTAQGIKLAYPAELVV